MSDIIRDVDESIKQEKLARLWKEYGPTLVVSAIALIVLTAVFSGWNAWQDSKNREVTNAMIVALAAPEPSDALIEVANKYPGRLSGLNYLNAGNVAFESGNKDKALESYKALADGEDATEIFQDLGQMCL